MYDTLIIQIINCLFRYNVCYTIFSNILRAQFGGIINQPQYTVVAGYRGFPYQ